MNTETKKLEGHNSVIPYLIVKDAAGLIELTSKLFGAVELMRHQRPGETTVMHAEVRIGDSVIMIAEATDEYKAMPAGLFIYVTDTDKTYQHAIAAGLTSVMEPYDTDYNTRGAGLKDAHGNTWWLNTVK